MVRVVGVVRGLTGALVHVAAHVVGGVEARAGRAHALEAARRVATLSARAVLQHADTP